MEFKITTDLTTAIPQEIAFNFDEMKAWLAERLEHYNSLVITEDSIKAGKDDRATLNKLRTAIDTRRKEIKKQCMAPYDAFEAKVKELTALIDQPIGAIDAQLKAYEEMRREEKQQKVAEAYDKIVPEALREIIPLTMIFSPKWLNASTTMKSIEEDLADRVKRTNTDMMVLDTVEPEYATAVRETYMRTLDIEKAMNQKKALQAAAEAFKQREEAKAAQEAEWAAQAACEPEIAPVAPQPVEETVYLLRLEMQLTLDQANALKTFLKNHNIKYTKI